MILFGGFTKPIGRSTVIQSDSTAGGVHAAEIELGARVTLIGCLLVPICRKRIILRNSAAVGVKKAKAALSFSIALVGERLPKSQSDPVVAALVSDHTILVLCSH